MGCHTNANGEKKNNNDKNQYADGTTPHIGKHVSIDMLHICIFFFHKCVFYFWLHTYAHVFYVQWIENASGTNASLNTNGTTPVIYVKAF